VKILAKSLKIRAKYVEMWAKCALILQKWHPKSKLVLFGQVRGNLSKFGPVSFEKTAPNMQ